MAWNTNVAWTKQEDDALLARIAAGESQVAIAASFPDRSSSSVLTRIGRLREGDGQNLERRKARNSSEKLWRATMALMAKMSEPELREALWPAKAQVPGTERVYKTAAIERMAA